MKTIGIVRRIDDLGRIVIPKEIRNTLRIKSGDNLAFWKILSLKPTLLFTNSSCVFVLYVSYITLIVFTPFLIFIKIFFH